LVNWEWYKDSLIEGRERGKECLRVKPVKPKNILLLTIDALGRVERRSE
jgi:hypothetical protein